jgi:hypothetical protein
LKLKKITLTSIRDRTFLHGFEDLQPPSAPPPKLPREFGGDGRESIGLLAGICFRVVFTIT